MYALFIGKGFAWILVLGYVDPKFAKAVTISNSVYAVLIAVVNHCISQPNDLHRC